jgi:hypothetical protein
MDINERLKKGGINVKDKKADELREFAQKIIRRNRDAQGSSTEEGRRRVRK